MFQKEKTKTLTLEKDNTTGLENESKAKTEVGKLAVVDFFLQLYKRQLGADPDSPDRFAALPSEAHGPDSLFELRVKTDDKLFTRRMTITSIGEDSGSRSKCFFVIYNVPMVIKIPPIVLDDFDVYLDSIRRDTKIAERLAPRECIVPRISVILKMIRTFDNPNLSQARLEKEYIKWLEKRPNIQTYLKIKGSFVYFMDLAKYYFLGNIVSKMQDDKNRTDEEIIKHPELIWEADDFEGRYGFEYNNLCEDLQHIYTQCRGRIKPVLSKHRMAETIRDYKIRHWFLMHLAQKELIESDADGKSEIIDELNRIFLKIMQENISVISKYRKLINEYIRNKMFSRNKPQIETITANLMELLAWLRQSKICIRDLKPDNLLVAGNPDNYPHFLKNAEDFVIGLIDVETATDLSEKDGHPIEQPLLGGTPSYATPSHLFANELIAMAYNDVARVLHYQDWHATLVMIYRVSTGNALFAQTGKILPGIPAMFSQQKDKSATGLADLVKKANRKFWQSAIGEFNRNRQEKKELLSQINVKLDETAAQMLKGELAAEKDVVTQALKTLVLSQNVYKTQKEKKQIYAASAQTINRLKVKLASGPDKTSGQNKAKRTAIKLLGDIERAKNHLERLNRAQEKLSRPEPFFSVFELMGILFDAILITMYNPQWGDLTGGGIGSFDNLTRDATYKDAVI